MGRPGGHGLNEVSVPTDSSQQEANAPATAETVTTRFHPPKQVQAAPRPVPLTLQSWTETRTAWLCWRRSWAAPPWRKETSPQTGRTRLETARRRRAPSCLLSCWTTASPRMLHQVGRGGAFSGNHGNRSGRIPFLLLLNQTLNERVTFGSAGLCDAPCPTVPDQTGLCPQRVSQQTKHTSGAAQNPTGAPMTGENTGQHQPRPPLPP